MYYSQTDYKNQTVPSFLSLFYLLMILLWNSLSLSVALIIKGSSEVMVDHEHNLKRNLRINISFSVSKKAWGAQVFGAKLAWTIHSACIYISIIFTYFPILCWQGFRFDEILRDTYCPVGDGDNQRGQDSWNTFPSSLPAASRAFYLSNKVCFDYLTILAVNLETSSFKRSVFLIFWALYSASLTVEILSAIWTLENLMFRTPATVHFFLACDQTPRSYLIESDDTTSRFIIRRVISTPGPIT